MRRFAPGSADPLDPPFPGHARDSAGWLLQTNAAQSSGSGRHNDALPPVVFVVHRFAASLAVLALGALAPGAHGATPVSGTLSQASPSLTWTGKLTSFDSWALLNRGDDTCLPLSCDTFPLTVADAPATLNLSVNSDDSDAYVEVAEPDGSTLLFGSAAAVTGTIDGIAAGDYVIHVAQAPSLLGTYSGVAELLFGVAPPSAPAAVAPPGLSSARTAPAGAIAVTTGTAASGRTIPVGLRSNGTLSSVTAALVRGHSVLARAALRQLGGTATITLHPRRAPAA